jgi:hypothetical protein
MWYRIKLGVADAAQEPAVTDGMELSGHNLEALMEQVRQQLLWATDGTRRTKCPALLGVLHVGLEIQVHRSWRSYDVSASEVEACLLAIQKYAMRVLSSGGCLPRRPTPMEPPDCQRN